MPVAFNALFLNVVPNAYRFQFYADIEKAGIILLPHLFRRDLCRKLSPGNEAYVIVCRISLPVEWVTAIKSFNGEPTLHPFFELGDWEYDRIAAKGIYKTLISLHSVLHNSNSLISNYRLF